MQKKYTKLGHHFYLNESIILGTISREQKEELYASCRTLTCPLDKYFYLTFFDMTAYI